MKHILLRSLTRLANGLRLKLKPVLVVGFQHSMRMLTFNMETAITRKEEKAKIKKEREAAKAAAEEEARKQAEQQEQQASK